MVLKIGKVKEKIFNQKQLLDGNNKSLLAVLQLSILGTSVLILLFQLFSAARINNLSNQRPTFAQLVNGETLYVSARERNFRYPEVIRKTVKDWILLSFNWEGTIAGTNEPDKGIPVQDSNRKVPFSMSIASVLLEPKFATATLKQMAEDVIPSELFSGTVRQVTIIHDLSEPRQITDTSWQVDVVATRRLIDKRSGATEQIPFNKTFKLRAVEIPKSPLGNQATLVEQLIYTTLSSGLQITDIVPFDPDNPQSSGQPVPNSSDTSKPKAKPSNSPRSSNN